MSHAEIAFAFVIGAISALGVILSAVLSSRASDRAARLAHEAMEHQTKLNAKGKIAEFRQEWINTLRNEMSKMIALPSDLERAQAQKASTGRPYPRRGHFRSVRKGCLTFGSGGSLISTCGAGRRRSKN